MEVEPAVLAEADADAADSLISANDPDDLANEQTWPTEEEMNGGVDAIQPSIPDAENGTTPKVVRRIPKGMSEYQAAWIIDEEDDEEDEDGEQKGDSSEVEMDDVQEEEPEEMQDMVMEEETDSRRSVAFQDLDHEEEERQ
jgi:pre-rRNA-processing protein TSR1